MAAPSQDWVRGCVYGAARALVGEQQPIPPGMTDRLEQLYQDHHSEMLELVGSNRIWRRLAQLYRERQGDQLGLGL